jgi:hypothetical protein
MKKNMDQAVWPSERKYYIRDGNSPVKGRINRLDLAWPATSREYYLLFLYFTLMQAIGMRTKELREDTY